jgi:F0F1-type ATP synthase assembly protein I
MAEPSEEELEQRLKALLGEAESADADHLDEIELKLREFEERLDRNREDKAGGDRLVDAEFEERIRKLHGRADAAKAARDGATREAERTRGVEGTSARGLGFGLIIAYSLVGPMIAGWGVGWLIDRGRGQGNEGQTWGTVVGMFAGFAMVVFLAQRAGNRK